MASLRMFFSGLAFLGVLSLIHPPIVQGQGFPHQEHLKVYKVENQVPLNLTLQLRDQFGLELVVVQRLELWSNPVDQNHEGVSDTLTHFSWWRILDPVVQPAHRLLVSNKFGADQEWITGQPTHLLTPAFKNVTVPGIPLPLVNHYKCYESRGPRLDRTVDLEDQWGRRTAVIDSAICFCTPVEKILPDGIHYPVVDPLTHLACYRIADPLFYGIPFFWRDQFVQGPNYAMEDCLLCVPSLKDEVVPTQQETWGHLKAFYR